MEIKVLGITENDDGTCDLNLDCPDDIHEVVGDKLGLGRAATDKEVEGVFMDAIVRAAYDTILTFNPIFPPEPPLL